MTPQQTRQLRARLAKTMADHVHTADQVMRGNQEWTATQARLFLGLLNKVLPDAKDAHTKDVKELSADELRAVVAEAEQDQDQDQDQDRNLVIPTTTDPRDLAASAHRAFTLTPPNPHTLNS